MRKLVLWTAAIATALVAAAPARAADGDPYVKSCVVTNVTPVEGCPTGALAGPPQQVAASPGGRQVYVTTANGFLQTIDRDPATGALSPRATGCFGPSAQCAAVNGVNLAGAYTLAVSHDGRTVAVSAGGHVLGFSRDRDTGTLTYAADAAGESLPGGAYALAFSPDDRFVYVRTSGGLDALRTDGLTQVGCYTDVTNPGCTDVAGLDGQSYEIGVSQDVVAVSFGTPGGVAVFHRHADGTLTQTTGTAGGCYSVDGKSGQAASQCAVGGASLGFAGVATISPDARFVYVGGASEVTALPLTPDGLLQPPVAAASIGTAEDLAATNDALVASTFGGVIRYFSAGTLAQLPGTKGCMNADGSGGCLKLAGLDGPAQRHTFLAADPAGLNVYATSDGMGMLASIVRDYGPVCHAASVTVPFGTATPIQLDCADPNGDPLTYGVVSGPAHGALSGGGPGQVVYTPAAGFSGADQFSYEATGRGVDSAPVTVALGVAPAPPVLAPVVIPVTHPAPPAAKRPRTVGALVATQWTVRRTHFKLSRLTISSLPRHWSAQIRCAGRHCPFTRRTLKGRAKHGVANVLGSLERRQRRFRAGQTLEVWVSAPGFNTKVARLALKKGRIPATRALCVAPGAVKPQKRCG
jgi:hypothetical protein